MDDNIKNTISSNICSKCGGSADDWKCPACVDVAKQFDPLHWKNCKHGGKMRAQCNACGDAEDNCKCEVKAF